MKLALAAMLVAPILLTGVGTAALLTLPEPDAPSAQLWIDSPLDQSLLPAGPVAVVGHAADGTDLTELTLEVDGQPLATQSTLSRYDVLAGVQFEWTATDGTHALQLKGGSLTSAVVSVRVGPEPSLGTPSRLPTTRPPSAKPTPTPQPSPSPTPSRTPTKAPTTTTTTTTTTTRTPRPTPTQTQTQDPLPLLGAVSVTPESVYAGTSCRDPIVVRATASGATSGSARVTASGLNHPIGGRVTGGVFTATFRQGDLYGADTSGTFEVKVTVANSGGSVSGSASVRVICSKD